MCVHKFSFSWADALGWISWIICKCMLNFLVKFTSYQQCVQVPISLHPQHFLMMSFLILTILICVKWCLVVLIHIFNLSNNSHRICYLKVHNFLYTIQCVFSYIHCYTPIPTINSRTFLPL